MVFLRLALVAIPLVTLSHAADPLPQTLSRMEQASTTFKGLTADFHRVVYTAAVQEKDNSSGSLAVRRGKSSAMELLMKVTDPYPQQIQFSGHVAQVYNPKTNIVSSYDVGAKYAPVMNQYMLLGFGSSPKQLAQAYSIALGASEPVNGSSATRIDLTPLKPDTLSHLVKAELWISADGIAIQQQLHYAGGDYNLATYSNMRINPAIPDSAIQLKMPSNVKRENPLK